MEHVVAGMESEKALIDASYDAKLDSWRSSGRNESYPMGS